MLAFACLMLSCMAGAAADAAAGAAAVGAAFKAPYIPAGDSDVLQEVPSVTDPAVASMQGLRAQFTAQPQGLPAAIELANAYVDYSRQIGDAHFAGYAEAIIAPWMAKPLPPPGALLTQATILQYRHQFDDARVLLNKALGEDARNAQGWLTLATLDMVQGNYQAARKDCAQVTNTAGFDLGLACSGNLLSYTGQASRSLDLLGHAAGAGDKVPASYQAWIQGLMAESAERLGDWPQAESHYLNALKLLPRDNFLLVAYADFLLDRGRAKQVLRLLRDHTQSDTAFLRLALAQSALRSPEAVRYTWIMAARFEALRQRGSDYFGREEARFALQLQHDPRTALDMARRNWQVQRAPWDARVLLAAAKAANQPRAATEALEFLQQTGLEDPIVDPLAQELRSQMQSHGK